MAKSEAPPPARLFALARELLFVADLAGRVLEANPAWARELGMTPVELLSGPFLERVHPDDRAGLQAYWRALLSSAAICVRRDADR